MRDFLQMLLGVIHTKGAPVRPRLPLTREVSAKLTEGENDYPSVSPVGEPAPLTRGAKAPTAQLLIERQLTPIQRRVDEVVPLIPQLQGEERRVALVDAL